jgi:DNA-binding transcriptional MerR regulator
LEQRAKVEEKPIQRLYYSIADVSKITGLKQYVLRYWETEFQELRPAKNRAGNRIYRKNDIRLVFLIKRLLYQEKYTIEGARQKLLKLKKDKDSQMHLSLSSFKVDDVVEEIRAGLKAMLEMLDGDDVKEAGSQPAVESSLKQE